MKYVSSLFTLLLTVPCYAHHNEDGWMVPDTGERILAGFQLIGLLLLAAAIFGIAWLIVYSVIIGMQKLFEKAGGKPEHFEQASGIMLGLYALGKRSLRGKK